MNTEQIAKTIDEMANEFLRWPLPESVCADGCATTQGKGRVGTNLLSFAEAKEMLRAVVLPHLPALTQLPVAGEAERLLVRADRELRDCNFRAEEEGRPPSAVIKVLLSDIAAYLPPPSAPTNGKASPQHATNDATPGATGSQHVGNGVAAPSSWAVEAAKIDRWNVIRNAVIRWSITEDGTYSLDHVCEDIIKMIDAWSARHAQSAGDGKDRERLDWWDQDVGRLDAVMSQYVALIPPSSLRAAIDAAMQGDRK